MSVHSAKTEAPDAYEIYYRQEAYKAARFESRQRQARQTAMSGSAHPLKYDESGFPIPPDKRRTLTDRIQSLLRP